MADILPIFVVPKSTIPPPLREGVHAELVKTPETFNTAVSAAWAADDIITATDAAKRSFFMFNP